MVPKCNDFQSAPERDLAAFDARATTYEEGWLGRLHHDIAERTARLAVSTWPEARRVRDVGCGTGYLLRRLAGYYPKAIELAGVGPAPNMVEVARSKASHDRLALSLVTAEHLPYADDSVALVVSTTSFGHWSDQLGELRECARFLEPRGTLVLVDQFSLWLAPTLLVGRRGKARTKRRCDQRKATTIAAAASRPAATASSGPALSAAATIPATVRSPRRAGPPKSTSLLSAKCRKNVRSVTPARAAISAETTRPSAASSILRCPATPPGWHT